MSSTALLKPDTRRTKTVIVLRPKKGIPAFTAKMRAELEAAAKKPEKAYRAYPRVKG